MTLTIKIATDNAAFDPVPGPEVASILRTLADQLADWPGDKIFNHGLRDSNGNTVGNVVAK